MTTNSRFKKLVRERMRKTGENYTAREAFLKEHGTQFVGRLPGGVSLEIKVRGTHPPKYLLHEGKKFTLASQPPFGKDVRYEPDNWTVAPTGHVRPSK